LNISHEPRAVIFAGGSFSELDVAGIDIGPQDAVIAADSGADHCLKANLTPHVVIGDMDSISPAVKKQLMTQQIAFHPFDPRKDFTDLELAVDYAIHNGFKRITILGAVGNRWDMTLANMLLLTKPELIGIKIEIRDARQRQFLIRGPETITITGEQGRTLSLVPIGAEARGIWLSGTAYPLENGILGPGAGRGVSNSITDLEAVITLKNGMLICIISDSEAIQR
jgi:thiamine pyrophosphokinase